MRGFPLRPAVNQIVAPEIPEGLRMAQELRAQLKTAGHEDPIPIGYVGWAIDADIAQIAHFSITTEIAKDGLHEFCNALPADRVRSLDTMLATGVRAVLLGPEVPCSSDVIEYLQGHGHDSIRGRVFALGSLSHAGTP
jgi:hypothetical protein